MKKTAERILILTLFLIGLIMLFLICTPTIKSEPFIRTYDLLQDGIIEPIKNFTDSIQDGSGNINADTITADTITAAQLNIINIDLTTISGTTALYLNLDVTDTANIKDLSTDTITANKIITGTLQVDTFIEHTTYIETTVLQIDSMIVKGQIKVEADVEAREISVDTANVNYLNVINHNIITDTAEWSNITNIPTIVYDSSSFALTNNVNDSLDLKVNKSGDTFTGDIYSTPLKTASEYPQSRYSLFVDVASGKLFSAAEQNFSGITYYFHNDTVLFNTYSYESLLTMPTSATDIIETKTLTQNVPILFDTYLSEPLGTTLIPAGTWELIKFASVDNTNGITTLTASVYVIDIAGVDTFLFSCTTTEINNTTATEYTCRLTKLDFQVKPTDRLMVKISGLTTSTKSPILSWYYEGVNYSSRIKTPLTAIIISNHNELNNLDYDNSGHTGFVSDTSLTNTLSDYMTFADSIVIAKLSELENDSNFITLNDTLFFTVSNPNQLFADTTIINDTLTLTDTGCFVIYGDSYGIQIDSYTVSYRVYFDTGLSAGTWGQSSLLSNIDKINNRYVIKSGVNNFAINTIEVTFWRRK